MRQTMQPKFVHDVYVFHCTDERSPDDGTGAGMMHVVTMFQCMCIVCVSLAADSPICVISHMAWFANDRDLLSAFQSRVIGDVEVKRRDSLTVGPNALPRGRHSHRLFLETRKGETAKVWDVDGKRARSAPRPSYPILPLHSTNIPASCPCIANRPCCLRHFI